MKTKDIVALVLLGVVLVVVGSLLAGRVGGGQKERSAEVEVVQPIDPAFQDEARDILLGNNKKIPAEVFSVPVNIKQGIGNQSPFNTQ